MTSDDTRRALLAALGIDASTDDAARDALGRSFATRANGADRSGARRRALRDPSSTVCLPCAHRPSRERPAPGVSRSRRSRADVKSPEGPWRGDSAELALPLDLLPRYPPHVA